MGLRCSFSLKLSKEINKANRLHYCTPSLDLPQSYYLVVYLLWWSSVLMLKSRWSLLCTQCYVRIFKLLGKKGKRQSKDSFFYTYRFRVLFLSVGDYFPHFQVKVSYRHLTTKIYVCSYAWEKNTSYIHLSTDQKHKPVFLWLLCVIYDEKQYTHTDIICVPP